MRYAIVSGTGYFVSDALAIALRRDGHDVIVLTAKRPRADYEVMWSPGKSRIKPSILEGVEVVFNLAGESIADRPWTKARRKVLYDSRLRTTQALIELLEQLQTPPKALIGVGGVGIFGDRADAYIDDEAPPGTGFLSELCIAWEQGHLDAEGLGCRVAVLRLPIVLSAGGGAFPLMVSAFRYVGGWLGNGEQFTPWCTERDAVRALIHLAEHSTSAGFYNASVPEPVRNRDWFIALGNALKRPVTTHAPRWALRGALGEYANSLVLASMRVHPRRLLAEGFDFLDTDAEVVFQELLAELPEGNQV